MTIEQIRNAYHAQPFKPFIIHLADGRHIEVQSREFISPAPSGRSLFVWQADDTYNVIDLLLVTDLEFKSQSNGSSRRRKS